MLVRGADESSVTALDGQDAPGDCVEGIGGGSGGLAVGSGGGGME